MPTRAKAGARVSGPWVRWAQPGLSPGPALCVYRDACGLGGVVTGEGEIGTVEQGSAGCTGE